MKARVSRLISKTPRNAADESDKHLEARDRRYLCLKSIAVSVSLLPLIRAYSIIKF